jgi:hypothetical protein
MNSASLCSLAGRYDNPIPTRCLAPIDFLKIPAQATSAGGINTLESILGILKSFKIRALYSVRAVQEISHPVYRYGDECATVKLKKKKDF